MQRPCCKRVEHMAFKGPFQPQIFHTASVQNVARGCCTNPTKTIRFQGLLRCQNSVFTIRQDSCSILCCGSFGSLKAQIRVGISSRSWFLNCWNDFAADSVWKSGQGFYSFRFIFWRQGRTIKENCFLIDLFIPHTYRSLNIPTGTWWNSSFPW